MRATLPKPKESAIFLRHEQRLIRQLMERDLLIPMSIKTQSRKYPEKALILRRKQIYKSRDLVVIPGIRYILRVFIGSLHLQQMLVAYMLVAYAMHVANVANRNHREEEQEHFPAKDDGTHYM